MPPCSGESTPRFGSDDMLSSLDGSRGTFNLDDGSALFNMGTGCATFHSVSGKTLFNLDSDGTLPHSGTPLATHPSRSPQQQGGEASTAMGRGKRSSTMNIFDKLIVDGDPPLSEVMASYTSGAEPCIDSSLSICLDMAPFHPNPEETETSPTQANGVLTMVLLHKVSHAVLTLPSFQGSFADFDFGFNDPPRMLSPFDETKCVASAIPMGPSQKKASGFRASFSSLSSDDGSLGEYGYTPYPADPPVSLSTKETEQDSHEFKAKYPKAIQATHQMNAALGICCNTMPTIPFHFPDWQYDSNVLIDNLEYHRSIQYGSTLYLKNISFFDITPDSERGFRAKKLLCHFKAEDMVALRASFVDMSAYGSGTWSYIVIGAKQAKTSKFPQSLLAIACPFQMVQTVRYNVVTWWDRGYYRKNVCCDLNYCHGGTPIIASQYVDPNLWGPIVNAMSTGCCRITYLVEDWCWPPQKLKTSP